MKSKTLFSLLIFLLTIFSMQVPSIQSTAAIAALPAPLSMPETDRLVRLSEIEIVPQHLQAYKKILQEEAAASVRKEPGVICIFPMFKKENPNQIRILEIYANQAAYQSHIKSPHFQHYKTTTLPMVKSLQLVDMESLDPDMMLNIFSKFK